MTRTLEPSQSRQAMRFPRSQHVLPQMIGNDEVLEKLSKDAMDKFDQRMAHEVDAILNGWR